MEAWKDRGTCVLFGDGAGAAVLTEGDNIIDTKLSAACDWDKLYQKNELQYSPFNTNESLALVMRGQEVFKFAVHAAVKDLTYLLNKNNINPDDVNTYVIHQANVRIINSLRDFLKQPEDKFPMNIQKYGNTSSASLPILLDELNRSGAIKHDDTLALSAFGAGFVSGACIMKW